MPCKYTNGKGKVIVVTVSEHALRRYIQRREKLDKCCVCADRAMLLIEQSFNRAERTMNTTYERRSKKYKGNSMYFKADGFVFVVENGTMVTVEIASKKRRYLN